MSRLLSSASPATFSQQRKAAVASNPPPVPLEVVVACPAPSCLNQVSIVKLVTPSPGAMPNVT